MRSLLDLSPNKNLFHSSDATQSDRLHLFVYKCTHLFCKSVGTFIGISGGQIEDNIKVIVCKNVGI